MQLRLDGKTALVTGGSKGIGLAIATAMAEAGASVMITSRKAEQLEAAAGQIGHGCEWRAGNAGDAEAASSVIDATIETFGGVDILVNNAAANPYAGPLIDCELRAWDKTIQVNLTAPFLWSQLVWQRYQAEHGGSMLNISSIGAFSTSPVLGVYDMTKAALLHLTEQLAAELGPKTRVNAICPGLVKTDFARMLWDGPQGDAFAAKLPSGRLGEPADIAGMAVFLASDAGSWITGQEFVVDGGALVGFA